MDITALDPALRSSGSSQNAVANATAKVPTSASSAPVNSNATTTTRTTQEPLRRDWHLTTTAPITTTTTTTQSQSQQAQTSPTTPRNHGPNALPPIQYAARPPPSTVNPTSSSSAAFNSPQTPGNNTTAYSPDNHNNTDPKKPRACESCRGLKVRCDPDPADPEGACKRCKKAKRECVITQPTRKRQKKTDSRVAELEKKIDALTQSLVATRNHQPPPLSQQQQQQQQQVQQYGEADRGRDRDRERLEDGMRFDQVPLAQVIYSQPSSEQQGTKRKVDDYLDRERGTPEERGGNNGARETASPDVVDREVISMGMAGELFLRYTTQMCQHLPGVVFPSGYTVTELRATKPILFLSIMAAASSEMPGLQKVLTKELMQVFAEKIIVDGQKSLELVQALQVAVIWYWPPERFEELKFYQLVHVAAVMAIEIGLGRKKQARGGFRRHIANAWRDHPMHRAPLDPTTIEARRAWLTCYFLATNTSMALHRANLIRWTPFMAECMDVLESSPEAVPTDKYFCHLVWTHKLAEEVGIQFSMDDPAYTPNIADSRTQYALRGFERELERYSSSIPRELQQPSLKMSFHVISLYMHEIATHSGDSPEDFRLCNALPGGSDNILGSEAPLSPAHINALSACLIAIDGIFEVYLSLDINTIRCLPVFNFVRVAYAVVVLIKLYFAASSPQSELGKVINKDNMKVEQHLEGLLEKFRATAADDRSRPAAKFLVVLVMLRSWFQKQKQDQGGKDEITPSSGSYPPSRQGGEKESKTQTPTLAPSSQPRPPSQGYNVATSMATTPLELLSEMAAASAGNTTNTTGTGTGNTPRPAVDILQPGPGVPVGWMNRQMMYDAAVTPSAGTPQQQQQDTTNTASAAVAAAVPPPAAFHPMNNSQNQGMPWLFGSMSNPFSALDFDYTSLGDGFAQAMDMTLGGFMDGTLMGEDGGVKYAFDDSAAWYPPPGLGGVSVVGSGGGGGNGGGGAVGGGVGNGGGGGYGF
ncbi:putative fungal-specific transcription protein [Cladorrhinum sp. PSN332]|nr:putative fungal-specific transcription protein [Cladorrhinum sp. PSN332]